MYLKPPNFIYFEGIAMKLNTFICQQNKKWSGPSGF